MDVSTEAASEVRHVPEDQEEDKDQEEIPEQLVDMSINERLLQAASTQTDNATQESGANTEPGWEGRASAAAERRAHLEERLDALMRERGHGEEERERHKARLQKKEEEARHQHQALMEKLESLRVKLQLNNSKAARKNFLSKKQELTSERSRAEKERSRLSQELEEGERQLATLAQEQGEDRRRWQEELQQLKQEMERAREEARQAERQAAQDEAAAVEAQRDAALAGVDAWLAELERYLNVLRVEFPEQFSQQRRRWEKEEAAVRRSRAELETRAQDVLRRLQRGGHFKTPPTLAAPPLPPLPTADLRFDQLMRSLAPPHFHPGLRPFLPQRPPQFHPDPFPPPRHAAPPEHYFNRGPPAPPHYQHRVTPPPSLSPSPPVGCSTPPPRPADKLEQFLEKLGAHFPQYNMAQLKQLLTQVKNSRGTLAGMSVAEVAEVGLRLAQGEAAAGPKLCPICQKGVEPDSRHPLSCSHVFHRDCIQLWLRSSPDKACPFCPGK